MLGLFVRSIVDLFTDCRKRSGVLPAAIITAAIVGFLPIVLAYYCCVMMIGYIITIALMLAGGCFSSCLEFVNHCLNPCGKNATSYPRMGSHRKTRY